MKYPIYTTYAEMTPPWYSRLWYWFVSLFYKHQSLDDLLSISVLSGFITYQRADYLSVTKVCGLVVIKGCHPRV